LDFVKTEQARRTINLWVEQKTKDKIKELLGPTELSSNTRLVLTNAIYFKAAWATPFLKAETKEALFEVSPTEKVAVAMMQTQEAHFNYFAGNDSEWLELPYKDGRLSMILLLPRKERFADLEKRLTASAIQEGLGKLKSHSGKVTLPRFKVTLAAQLAHELIRMGMSLAFSGGADFSGMASDEGLRIGSVIHQAYLSADEVGSEAAAATAVEINSCIYPPFSFPADRPFVFLRVCLKSPSSRKTAA
jgi:serpin B